MEKFKRIEGFERYSISNLGNVINNVTGNQISQRLSTHGYLRVNLRTGLIKNERPKTAPVHQLVAKAFIPKADGKDYINHIDGCKTNNNVDNLEWCTAKENTRHAISTGLMNPNYKAMNTLSREKSNRSHNTIKYRKKMQKINKESGITTTVIQINTANGAVMGKFDNCHEAARFLFPGSKNKDRLIARCARGQAKSAYGYSWEYKGGGSTS